MAVEPPVPCAAPQNEIVVALGVGWRAFDPHLRPRGVEFLGDQGRQAGVDALAHFQMLDDHRHRVVLADAQECIRPGLPAAAVPVVLPGPDIWAPAPPT